MALLGIIATRDAVFATWVAASGPVGMGAGAGTAAGAGIVTAGGDAVGTGVDSDIADDGAGVEAGAGSPRSHVVIATNCSR